MNLSRQQLDVVRRARARARARGATRVEKLALTAALGVESNYTELRGGDRDSTGALQQRPSQGWGPIGESLERDVDQFLDHARQYRGKINDPGELAQAVQRSAFPERYGQRMSEARQALRAVRGKGGGTATLGTPGTLHAGQAPSMIPGSTSTDTKGAMLAALMDHRKDMSLLQRYHQQVGSGNYAVATPTVIKPGQLAKYQPGNLARGDDAPSRVGSGRLGKIKAEADRIDQAHVPYLWGGGHAGKQARGSKVTPLDCSGAVSRLLGINPRVAQQFKSWGKAGRGKNLTIWAASDHVLVEIGGHFWGTSGANPGGGAGWIPRSQISSSYLSRFTPRHI